MDPGEEEAEGGGEEEVCRAKLEQDRLGRQPRQRTSESAGGFSQEYTFPV